MLCFYANSTVSLLRRKDYYDEERVRACVRANYEMPMKYLSKALKSKYQNF